MQEMLDDMNIDMSVGGKHIILKGDKKIGWTLTDALGKTTISPEIMRRVVIRSKDPLTEDLLAKLTPGSFPGNAPPEAQLHYPGSSVVLDSFESDRTSGGTAESRAVYKTTLATEADAAQVQAWYREWLVGHGWELSPSTSANSESSQDYIRASEHFRLGVAQAATLTSILAVPIPAGTKTVYEVEYSNAVDRQEIELPVCPALCLIGNSKGAIIQGALFDIHLVPLLHFDNKTPSHRVHTIDIVDAASIFG